MAILRMLLVTVVLGWGICAVWGETVQLQGGYEVRGDVLKATRQYVVVDIGVAVLQLPQSAVVEVVGGEAGAAARGGDPNAVVVEVGDGSGVMQGVVGEHSAEAWQLYRTADLQADTIENNADRYGQAVVMVTSPGGQGSGFVVSADGYVITNYHVIARETLIKVTVF